MRVLLASFVADSRATGMGKWSHRVGEALEARGHAVTLWFADDFPLVRRTGRAAFLVHPVAMALRLARRHRAFDVVVLHEPSGLWYGVLRRAWRGLPPLVAMCHNVEAKVFEVTGLAARRGFAARTAWAPWVAGLLRLPQSRGAVRLADAVVCLSSEDRAFLIEVLHVRPGRITLMLNGAEPGAASPARPRPPGRRALFVGGWLDIKGRRLLPRLWAAVRDALPDACLTLAGVHAGAAEVTDAFRAGDRAGLTVVPSVEDEGAMRALLASHDALIVPSLSEGSPLTLIEALAAGLPVVAAGVGGVPDLVTDGRDGLLFRFLDAAEGARQLVRVLADPALASRLAAAGRERARALTWDAAAAALETAIAGARQ